MREIIINTNDAGQRLDKFLSKFMPSLPKSMLYKSLRKNCVKINDKHIKTGDYMLCDGDNLKLYFKDEFFRTETKSIDFGVPLQEDCIIYEDENIIVIDKPSGLVVHTDDEGEKNTLVNMLRSYLYAKGEYNPENEHSFSPALCNRLDKNTSGLVIAAKNAPALRIINEKIKLREIKKFYICAVEGHPEKEGVYEAHIVREEKKVKISDHPVPDSKPIKTGFKVIKYYDDYTLLEIELFTGRTHQIRAHMAHLGYPLCGDVKYGAKTRRHDYQALQSYKLKLDFAENTDMLGYLAGREFISKIEFGH